MPDESVGDNRPASTRHAHGRHEEEVDHHPEVEFKHVLPPAVVEPLPQQFQDWLRALLLLLGHVQVIHQDQPFLVVVRPEDACLPPL